MITNEELLEWINSMPLWIRKATLLYYQNNTITDADVKKLADYCLEDDGDYKVEGINLINHGEKKSFVIKSVDAVEGVNAISSTKPLVFGKKGITVVYGLNGAGKSGYIRIFKMIAGAKYREEIKGNIYSGTKTSPKATVTLIGEDGQDIPYECDLKRPGQYEELRNIDIFDTKISSAYVNEAKEAAYEPWVFSLFSEMANVANRIKSELKSRESKYIISEYGFPEYLKETASFKKIQDVTWKSRIENFPTEWSDEQENNLQELKKKNQIEVVQVQIKQLESALKNIKLIQGYFGSYSTYFGTDNWGKIIQYKQDWTEAFETKTAAELLFKQNSSELDSESVGVDAWKKLWQYARQYYNQVLEPKKEEVFTKQGGICPLCRQMIATQEASVRMETIDAYVNGKAVEKEVNALKTYEGAVRNYPKPKSKEEITTIVEASGMEENAQILYKCQEELESFAELIKSDIKQIELSPVKLEPIITFLAEQYAIVENKINELKPLVALEENQILLQQIKEIEAEKLLVSVHPILAENIKKLNSLHALEIAEKKTITNKITVQSKKLAEQMITAEYISRFDNELKELTKSSIEVKLVQQRAGSGKIPYKVVLCDASGDQIAPQDILSEGENRVTSLAAFFAESSGRSENTPLIVDDPISSLDYSYEASVIDRLVKAAEHRQVIVFTHRISMVVGINEVASNSEVMYNEISLLSSKTRKGVPSDISNIGGKVKAQLNSLINDNLSKLKKMDEFSTEYRSLFHNTCQDFRNIVEKSVEDELLGGVVKRFRKEVQTKNRLAKLAEITTEDCNLIDRLMTRYSYYDHSMSDEAPLLEFTIQELESDLYELKNWLAGRK